MAPSPFYEEGLLRLRALRGGTASELAAFLTDIEIAYNALCRFELSFGYQRGRGLRPTLFWFMESIGFIQSLGENYSSSEVIVPDLRLEVRKVVIRSPGFWEFIGALNPLQQIREYLRDRHERRKDRDYREQSEKDRLRMENEMIQRNIVEKEMHIFREQIAIARELGIDEERIKQIAWERLGPSLAKLGQHQDRGLIGEPLE